MNNRKRSFCFLGEDMKIIQEVLSRKEIIEPDALTHEDQTHPHDLSSLCSEGFPRGSPFR